VSNQPSTTGKAIRRGAVAATVAVLLLPAATTLHARARHGLDDSAGREAWRRVNITILARGSHVSDSSGNMDSYLVLLSERKSEGPVAARLVDYRSEIEPGLSDEAIRAHPQVRVRVTPAAYCAMDASGFVVRRAFDPEAVSKLRGSLLCLVVRR